MTEWNSNMVVDKTLDKYLADIIFATACNGFEYNRDMERYQLKVSHVTAQMFGNMAERACEFGKKLTIESVNTLLSWTQEDAFYYDKIQYSLPVSLLLNGESIRIRFLYNESSYFVDLMKMTESEFLILQTDFGYLHNRNYMQIFASDSIAEDKTVYIPSCGYVDVVQAWLVKPLDYHCYADWHYMRNLWRFDVNKNLWNVYNSLSEFVNERTSWDSFLKMMDVFCKNGLSTFVFRMMLNSIKR